MEQLKTNNIQVWHYGTMLRTVSKQKAIEMVKSGLWVIMTEQAIASAKVSRANKKV